MANLPTVYLETTVVNYLAARPNRDPKASLQRVTRRWFKQVLPSCAPHVSQLVLAEVARVGVGVGAEVAQRRLEPISDLPVLLFTPEVQRLGDLYLSRLALPVTARLDAYHLALAAWHGMEYLVSWDLSRVVEPRTERLLRSIDASQGLASPTVGTPEELMDL